MAAENPLMCLLGAMDRLWFHQIILFAEPSLFPHPKTPEMLLPSSKNNSETSLSTDQESLVISETAVSADQESLVISETAASQVVYILSRLSLYTRTRAYNLYKLTSVCLFYSFI